MKDALDLCIFIVLLALGANILCFLAGLCLAVFLEVLGE